MDLTWSSGRLKESTITSTVGRPCRVVAHVPVVVRDDAGREVASTATPGETVTFETEAGQRYRVVAER